MGLVLGVHSSFMGQLAFIMRFLLLSKVAFRLNYLAGVALSTLKGQLVLLYTSKSRILCLKINVQKFQLHAVIVKVCAKAHRIRILPLRTL